MKTDLTSIKQAFASSYSNTATFRREAEEVYELYHNNQFSLEDLQEFRDAGIEPESFNVIKAFTRMLLGYYSNIVTGFKATPNKPTDNLLAQTITDLFTYILEDNDFEVKGERVKLQGFLTGLFIVKIEAQQKLNIVGQPDLDPFGRPLVRTDLDFVDYRDIVYDHLAIEPDFNDIEHLHFKKYITREEAKKLFGSVGKLQAFLDFTGTDDYSKQKIGNDLPYNIDERYLIVQSYVKDDDGNWNLVIWHNDIEAYRSKIEYLPFVLSWIDKDKYNIYGIFRDVIGIQKNINKALLRIAKYVNSERVIVQENSVDDIKKFERDFKNLSKVLPVKTLSGIQIEKFNVEIQQQFLIADRALDRIQFILGINDSFLGQAFASDSGRKVKLQQNSSMMRLRYIDTKLNLLYKQMGDRVLDIIRKYYKAYQIMAISDEDMPRFFEINRPIIDPATNQLVVAEQIDDKGSVLFDEDGQPLVEPLTDYHTDIRFADVKLNIVATNYADEKEQTQILTETVMNGTIGQVLLQMNPAGYMKMASLLLGNTNVRNATKIKAILDETAMMLQPQPHMQEMLVGRASGGGAGYQQASTHKLPQNTEQGTEGNI